MTPVSELDASPAIRRVADRLVALGHAHPPVMLDAAARTAQQAADALGVALGQIAKSIIFRRKSDERAQDHGQQNRPFPPDACHQASNPRRFAFHVPLAAPIRFPVQTLPDTVNS